MSNIEDGIQAYSIGLELIDRPGELLRALAPIGENGGNLLSVVHERGNTTPRGRIPIEIDFETRPSQYPAIINGLEGAGVNIVHTGIERYSESLTVILSGHIVDSDLSDTLSTIRDTGTAKVTDLSLSASKNVENSSSIRLELSIEDGKIPTALSTIRGVAENKDYTLIEPLIDE